MVQDEQTYLRAATETLGNLLQALDVFQDEFDAELANDILTIEFRDGERCVINSHRAARQIWLAAERKAWHFDNHPGELWLATKTGDELWKVVENLVSKQLKRDIQLRAGAKT
jgi:CyaY protein